MFKGNKGEWAEPYVALKLLGEQKLYLANDKGQKNVNEWLQILELIRQETKTRVVCYRCSPSEVDVNIYINDVHIKTLPASFFELSANQLSLEILNGKGVFSASEHTQNNLCNAEITSLKALSTNKNDIFLSTADPRSGIQRKNIGFSIKSQYASHNPTLFNTAKSSAAVYRLKLRIPDFIQLNFINFNH